MMRTAVNLLVAFYDIHQRKRDVLFFCFVPDSTQDFDLTVINQLLCACEFIGKHRIQFAIIKLILDGNAVLSPGVSTPGAFIATINLIAC
jgi:hypothetical protein